MEKQPARKSPPNGSNNQHRTQNSSFNKTAEKWRVYDAASDTDSAASSAPLSPVMELDPPLDSDNPPASIESVLDAAIEGDNEATEAELSTMPDRDVRYTDAEILGKSYAVRQFMHSSANNSMRAAETVSAKFKNLLETPGKIRQRFVQFIAQKRYDRHKRRFDAVNSLPEGNHLRVRREAKLNRATIRLDNARSALEQKGDRMSRRTDGLEAGFESRRESYVTELVRRKESALARRELRRSLKEQGASRLESRSITKELFKEVPLESLQRLGRLARIVELSEADLKGAESLEKRAGARKGSLESDLKQNNEASKDLIEKVTSAQIDLEKITDPYSNESIASKKVRLTELQDTFDTIPDDDPSRETIQVEIGNLEEEVENAENEKRSLELTIDSLNRRIKALAVQVPILERQIHQAEIRRDELAIETADFRANRDLDAKARDQATQEVLTNELERN